MSTPSDSPTRAPWRTALTVAGPETLLHGSAIAFKACLFTLVANLVLFRSSMVAINIGCTLLALAWAPLVSRQWRVPGLVSINLFISLLLFTDIGYQRYFDDFLSATVAVFQLDQIGNVKKSASNLAKLPDFLWFSDLALLAVWSIRRRLRGVVAQPQPALSLGARARAASTLVLLGVFLVGIPVAQRIDRHGGRIYGSLWSHSHFTEVNGILLFHAFDMGTFIRDQVLTPTPDEEELQMLGERLRERQSRREGTERSAPLFGVARGASVITIQLEAIQAHVLGLKMGGEEVTPVLNKLASESLNFERYYHQTAQGRTSDAEFSTLCSLCPLNSGSVFIRYPDATRPCLPRLLAKEGYSATSYHGYFGSFWNRKRAYPSVGFQDYVSADTLDKGHDIGLGLSDEDFYDQIGPMVTASKEPFFAHVISLTSHHPFTMPEEHLSLDTGAFAGTPFEHYLASVRYADKTMGSFLDELDKEGLLDRSILVIYGDHDMGYLAGAERAWEELLGLDKSNRLDRLNIEKRVPMLIRLPGGEHARTLNGVSGMVDLAPTLLHLLGLTPVPHEMIGRNRLGDTPGLVTFRDGSVLTDETFFYADRSGIIANGECWSNADGKLLDVEDCAVAAQAGLDHLTTSDHFIRHSDEYLPVLVP